MSSLICPVDDCRDTVPVYADDPDAALSDLADHIAGHGVTGSTAVLDLLATAQEVPC